MVYTKPRVPIGAHVNSPGQYYKLSTQAAGFQASNTTTKSHRLFTNTNTNTNTNNFISHRILKQNNIS